jgi:hypothetical protein
MQGFIGRLPAILNTRSANASHRDRSRMEDSAHAQHAVKRRDRRAGLKFKTSLGTARGEASYRLRCDGVAPLNLYLFDCPDVPRASFLAGGTPLSTNSDTTIFSARSI